MKKKKTINKYSKIMSLEQKAIEKGRKGKIILIIILLLITILCTINFLNWLKNYY